ncbi:8-oxoguanine deaminase [bioreactor metagenome]|uniref:8-oxoguanine deaminase n=1 Tax=bioreactor metagenome TaxID=1076179 RepID=A0A645GQK7_9ZZZZ
MREAGVPVGIAVDGSASNDSGHLLGETRQAMLLARVGFGPAAMSARQALELATLGGAKVLNRDDIGALAPGMSADLVAFATGGLDQAGAAVHDPVAALVFCTPQTVRHSVINGKPVVTDGHLLPLDLPPLVAEHNRLARQLANTAH